ncbi:sigma 54-interacting transcriptional regulator [Enterococcus hulanensis]|uniref:sigma 54-interacting transcriptional regulator n=1 Tax=Enterococcus hulanensis TaxID=2559929 RepID=UPI001A8FD26A|nr:sigma 54-interacting transcriptional regulator [Enterococcus hulanensis]MBO0458202.1 sigma 54-interacting transcriptional regulator [Enterococcus hulanensis]
MSVQDEIFDYIETNYQDEPVTASEIAEKKQLSRNTVSHYLNRLADEGFLKKIKSKPTIFVYEKNKSNFDPFKQLIGYEGSLRSMVKQFKSSVMYPNGLPLILNGASGTGKSFIAKLIYEYAKEMEQISKEAPFVVLNCADYGNNPELLSSVLFGYVSGAFTGATQEKKGLLDEANGGYLFLDEVHNLTSENQEKLFLLIDSGKFRRLGENEKWKKTNVRLIMATTEDTQSTLLTTFRRRIPYEVILPQFFTRPLNERIELVRLFFQQESIKINRKISVSHTLIDELSKTDFDGNIGQLKNHIKVLVANELSEQFTDRIIIPSLNSKETTILTFLPENSEKEPEFSLSSLDRLKGELETIQTFSELREKSKSIIFLVESCFSDSNKHIETQISAYFSLFGHYNIEEVVAEVLKQYGFLANKLQRKTIARLLYFFSDYGYLFDTKLIIENNDQAAFRKFFEVASGLLTIYEEHPLRSNFNLLISAYLLNEFEITSEINALIVMHGKDNAKTLATTVNEMIGDYVFDYFGMPSFISTQEIIKEIVSYTRKVDTSNGLVILVDMGSLEKIYSSLKGNVNGDLIVMNNVSTSLSLEVGMKLHQNVSIRELEQLDLDYFKVDRQYFEGVSQKPNILIACLSGQGISTKIKDIFTKHLSDEVEVLTFDYLQLVNKCQNFDEVFFKNTIAVITTPKIENSKQPILSVEEIVNDTETLSNLQPYLDQQAVKECGNDILKLFTIEGASDRLNFLNPERVINEVGEVIEAYEEYYQITFPNFVRINLFLHMSLMIERILTNGEKENTDFIIKDTADFEKFRDFSDVLFSKIRKKYNISIPISEYGMVYQLVSQITG